jgi:hypothetical protein
MHIKHPVLSFASVFVLALVTSDANGSPKPPTQAQIDFAVETSDLMTATVVAALVQEIGETTVDNVAQGNLSIGLIFDDRNHNMRLVGELEPLSDNDYPRDDFEEDALADALAGQPRTSVEKVSGQWYYRRSIPLSNFAPQCALCHENFADLPASEYVGALMLRIPIE